MKTILPVLLLFSTTCFAGKETQRKSDIQYYQVTNHKMDESLPRGQALIEFTFKEHSGICLRNHVHTMHNNKKVFTPKIDTNGISFHTIKPGKYKFKFWTSFTDTLSTDEIEIKNQHSIAILVHLHSNELMIESDKPVIYLYPETATQITLQLNYNGKLNFTYPEIKNNTWKINANPDGTIEANNKLYNYLFWEGEMNANAVQTNIKEGSVVDSKNLISFFESNLTAMGMNTKESADFITYWAPRMMKNEKNYIYFMLTNDYDKIASMNVTPKPDNQLRIYMIWTEITSETVVDFKPQSFPQFKREGFTLVEWGGSEITNLLNEF